MCTAWLVDCSSFSEASNPLYENNTKYSIKQINKQTRRKSITQYYPTFMFWEESHYARRAGVTHTKYIHIHLKVSPVEHKSAILEVWLARGI